MQTGTRVLRSGALSLIVPQGADRMTSARGAGTVPRELAESTVRNAVETALNCPLVLPPIAQCVIPGDRVALAMEPDAPLAVPILTAVVEELQSLAEPGVELTLLLPEDPASEGWSSLLAAIPSGVREKLGIVIHNPDDRDGLSYLASTAGGERLYLNHRIVNADLIVSIGPLCFDSRLGVRGGASSFYPQLADRAAAELFRRDAHPELAADSPRPLRDLVDEVGWLLGTQFVAGVIPESAGSGPQVLAGDPQAVLEAARREVAATLHVEVAEPVELVAVSIPGGTSLGWKQLGLALEQAARVVEPGGRIVVVADLAEPQGPAATMLRRCVEPEDLLTPLRREPVADSREIVQIIMAQRHARVYLLSALPAAVVEELGLIPLVNADEASRLLSLVDRLLVVPNACFHRCDVAARRPAGTRGAR
jgi:hypothetical protein